MKTFLGILILLLSAVLPTVPFLLELWRFRCDCEGGRSHRRFRIVIYSLIYAVAATVVLRLLGDVLAWLEELWLVRQLAGLLAPGDRTAYFAKVAVTVLVNFAVGLIFVLLQGPVRIGLGKKREAEDGEPPEPVKKPKKTEDGTEEPEGGDGESKLSLGERIVRFFHHETFFFVKRVLLVFDLALSAMYTLIFVLYQLPALFGAEWLPYDLIYMLFRAGYVYPTVTLLVLWELYFFLAGIHRAEEEDPEVLEEDCGRARPLKTALADVDKKVKKEFGAFYSTSLTPPEDEEEITVSHHPLTERISAAVEKNDRDKRQTREIYKTCLDEIAGSEDDLVIRGSFFSPFSAYLLRYLSTVTARGDNVVLVCNSDEQIEAVHRYVTDGLSSMTGLYGGADTHTYDHPIWHIVKVGDSRRFELQKPEEKDLVDQCSILVTTMNFLCSSGFEISNSRFLQLLDTMVFVDAYGTISEYGSQLAVFNARLRHFTKSNALLARNGNKNRNYRVRYMSHPVRYLCFDETGVTGMDRVLANMLSVPFRTADAYRYNPRTMLRCYHYEGTEDKDGRRNCPAVIRTEEALGPAVNMALLSLAKGADTVSVFTDGAIPCAGLAETVGAYRGRLPYLDGDDIKLDQYAYDPDDYSVILAIDRRGDLPAAVRKYASMTADKHVLVMLLSRQYMLRDYYEANLDALWEHKQLTELPSDEGTAPDVARRILIRSNAGGITEEEVLNLCRGVPHFQPYVRTGNVNGLLRAILKTFGIPQPDRVDLFRHFEYVTYRDFDESGRYVNCDRIVLRHDSYICRLINGRDMAVMVVGEEEYPLSIPRSRLGQNHIMGQNLLYDGRVYRIRSLDPARGRVYADLVPQGRNREPYEYVQIRSYYVECPSDGIELVYPPKHQMLSDKAGDVRLDEIILSAFRAPLEVTTDGYYPVDPHLLTVDFDDAARTVLTDKKNDARKLAYRRYGRVTSPVFTIKDAPREADFVIKDRGALMMTVRLVGSFGEDKNSTAALAAVMLEEILHSMYPSVADALVVCPVLNGMGEGAPVNGEDDGKKAAKEADAKILGQRRSSLTLGGSTELFPENDLELLIIEDNETDLGVIASLMLAGDDVLHTLFSPIREYLEWYSTAEKKSEYLYFGLDHEPACFDFASVRSLARILGESEVRFSEIDNVVEYVTCDFCGKRFRRGESISELDDERLMCHACAKALTDNSRRELKEYLDRARRFLENTYGVELGDDYDFCFESTLKIANTLKQDPSLRGRGSELPLHAYIEGKKVHVEKNIPAVNLAELLVRELTHTWQLKHAGDVSEELAGGHIAMVGINYLRFLREDHLAEVREDYYESTSHMAGEGYRTLVKELTANPQFLNNPFRYLLEGTGSGEEGSPLPPPPPPRITVTGDFGAPYTPEQPDRVTDGTVPYFYRERLDEKLRDAYDKILEAAQKHENGVGLPGCSTEEQERAFDALMYDHPELFYLRSMSMVSMVGAELIYGATAEEVAELNRRIEEAIPAYLEGIDDTMSAYDVAIRLHVKLINAVDYDTIALNREKAAGGPEIRKIDPLRSICGVFLDRKAVCEGYARAIQYLLQKCGVECAECVGHTFKDGQPDGAHAWNILKLDGDYYYLDCTWDDNSDTIRAVKQTDAGFDYFCVTSEEMSRSRHTDLCPVEMPDCRATRCNYYYHNGFVIDRCDPKRIGEIAEAMVKRGERSFTFKCASQEVFNESLDRLCNDGKECFAILKDLAKLNKQILATKYSYSYDKRMRTVTILLKFQ